MHIHLASTFEKLLDEENEKRKERGDRELEFTNMDSKLRAIERKVEEKEIDEGQAIEEAIQEAKKYSYKTWEYFIKIKRDIYKELRVPLR